MSSSSSSSWSPDGSNSSHQSLWLQTTLSEWNKKTKAMMTLLEENENSSSSVEIHSKRKSELIQVVEDFNRTYRSLAEQHHHLRCKSHYVLRSASSSSSSNSRKIRQTGDSQKRVAGSYNDPKVEEHDSHSKSINEVPDVDCHITNFDFDLEYLNRLADELMSTECKTTMATKMKIEDNEMDRETRDDFVMDSCGWENTWPELKFEVTKLMVENLRQKTELLKRNDEKRKTINRLQAQLESLKSENRALQSCLRSSKIEVKSKQFQTSRLRELGFSKFFKAGCS